MIPVRHREEPGTDDVLENGEAEAIEAVLLDEVPGMVDSPWPIAGEPDHMPRSHGRRAWPPASPLPQPAPILVAAFGHTQ